MYDTILVPLDGSQHSEQALPQAIDLARRFGAELVILQVAEELDMPHFTSHRVEILKAIQDYLATRVEDAMAQGARGRRLLREGDPAQQILEVAGEEGADLIVMASHGRTGLGRWQLGSVTDKVLRHGHTPVLVVRPGGTPTGQSTASR